MLGWLEFVVGLLVWLGVIWDGFATIVLPRTVAPMKRLSGRFNRWSWRLWAAAGRRVSPPDRQLIFLAIYGPISVMVLLILWGGLMILAFTLIFQGMGPRFQGGTGPLGFGAMLYMSASTFLTLGLGDVTSTDPIARFFIILEAGTGYVFLGLIITYMPVLEQAYGSREVGNVLIHSRAGHPPGAIKLLHRYSAPDRQDLLPSNLREGERWMAEILQSHLSHPVLSFYRAQHWGRSWLVSLTTLLDSCAMLIVGWRGTPRRAGEAHLSHGPAPAQGPHRRARPRGRSPGPGETDRGRCGGPHRRDRGLGNPVDDRAAQDGAAASGWSGGTRPTSCPCRTGS